MRRYFLAFACFLALAACALLSAKSGGSPTKVRVRLVDAVTGKTLGGIVRIFPKDANKPLHLPGLFPRFRGVKPPEGAAGWHVVPAGGSETTLPPRQMRLEAVSGLDTVLTRLDLDDPEKIPAEITVKLTSAFRPDDHGLVAGNTHLHLMKLSKEEAEEYLQKIPAADGLRVLFISYLERFQADAEYITNRYPVGDLPQFQAAGVLVNNGEEQRHNFGAGGEGYGHVMLLNIKDLVKPVSLGPGITGKGFDDRPLRPGIDNAKKQGGTIIWCHNSFGTEDVPSALTGRLDALNVFDGSRRGSFEESYYRYLNVGLRLPISTGTDWFVYDFSRVYAKVEGKLSIQGWLDALKAGRCQATNSPLLSLIVDGKDIGATLKLSGPKMVRVEASATGRHDFQELQLVHNGKVIRRKAAAGPKVFQAKLVEDIRVEEPSWFAVRIESKTQNELGLPLFAHTSPVYVDVGGKKVFEVEAARGLLAQIEESQANIRTQGKFSDPKTATGILALYDNGANKLREWINQRGK